MLLCLLTMLSVKEYAIFLMMTDLVTVSTKTKQDGFIVGTPATNTWQPLLIESNIHNHGLNLAEATTSVIYTAGLMQKQQNSKRGSFWKQMHLLGIGNYEPGVTTKARWSSP